MSTQDSVASDVMLSNARRFMALFEGYTKAYGTYNVPAAHQKLTTGKVEIKSTARTVRRDVTPDTWLKHLRGEQPLGIIPIRDNDTCLWGALDIDVYDLNFSGLHRLIRTEKLPLVLCRTKSGGAHLFVFVTDPVPAEVMQARLREMAVILEHGVCEVFPKQRTVALERGDMGNWLNMPYFGGDETDRYGIKASGTAMTMSEFLTTAEGARIDGEALMTQSRRKTPKRSGVHKGAPGGQGGDPDFGDGPPCMQHLSAIGYPEGSRNKGLFNLGVFAKRKYAHRWQEVLEAWNRAYFEPPLPSSEVSGVIKSLEKKDFYYQCKEHPLRTYCNASLCRTRKFGVGGEDDYPTLSGMSVMKTTPPLWFVDVNDFRMELTTEQLQNYPAFHKACMEQMYVCFKTMKNEEWLSALSAAMRDAVEIEVPQEGGVPGRFMELLEDFLMNRHRGEQKADILVGRPWEDNGKHFFRLRDLEHYLETQGFRIYSRGQIISRIRTLGGSRCGFNIQGKFVNVWWVPANFTETPEIPLPELEHDPI